ncbi:hypothetical protein [Microbacterium sp. SORGH_AS_0888]|uniref:hypothetical protein n=1 Tax=Microbacterium sp. SORGH_AS_0888 TaxID=3041791 RepID=UPI0027800A14|nr:hypothetical protein [Microbacterium sp. SORGH_AS_0888]MDQ1128714.1 hypothetical protein [Microbacterium sp. SORGH_AS_0888]
MSTRAARSSIVGRVVRHPLSWAAVCATGAAILAPGLGLDLPVYLLILASGFLCGYWFVGLTLRDARPRRGLLVHVIVAVLLVPLFVLLVEVMPGLLPRGAPRTALAFVSMGVVPAAGWIWLGLISRVTGWVRSRERRVVQATAEWEHEAGVAIVHVGAVRLSMRALALGIAVAIALGGSMAVVVLIAVDDIVTRWFSPQLAVVLFGGAIALPVYGVLAALVRRRTSPCTIAFDRGVLRITVGGERRELAFRDIRLLRWRQTSEYARLEVRVASRSETLLIGMARQAPGVAAALPPLPRRVEAELVRSGLQASRTRRGVDEYRRPSAHGRTGTDADAPEAAERR